MGQEFLEDCLWPQTRKRPSPALAPEISDDALEYLECRPHAHKFPKLSNGAEDELTLDLTHSDIRGGNVSCHSPLGGLSPGLVPLASTDGLILSAGDNANLYNAYSTSNSSPHAETQPTSVTNTLLVDIPDINPHYQGNHEYSTCFGMIVEQVSNIRLGVLGTFDGARIDVALKVSGNSVMVRHHDSLAYGGLLRQNLARPLIKVSEQYRVTLVAFILEPAKSKDVKRESGSYQLCITVYGSQEASRDVGEVLDHAGIYLQHPLSYDTTVPYINPHYLVRPGGTNPTPTSEEHVEASIRPSLCLITDARLKGDVSQLIDSSAQGPSNYFKIAPSSHLRTNLKSHQEMALSMMVEKESGKMEGNDFENLWTRVAQRDGEVRYRNAVTGSTRVDAPPLCLGGLLADDMGLGKTLTMLALIMSPLVTSSQLSQPSSEGVRCRSTLIVTPLSLLGAWEEQIRRHIHSEKIKWHIYHGSQRRKKALELMSYDVVLTTYDTVVGDDFHSTKGSKNGAKLLHVCDWHRVVLDEAHLIRNASSKRHRSLSTLKARHRWCLTGTPIFNKVEDLGALLSFLKVYPFDSASYFNSHISAPLSTNPEKALSTLRKLFRCTSLRRTKDAVIGELQLAPRFDAIQEVKLNQSERRQYDVLKKSFAYFIRSTALDIEKSSSGSSVLQTITRLRQVCNHGLDLLPRETRDLFGEMIDEEEMTRAIMTASKKCDSCETESSAGDLSNTIFRAVWCGHTICSGCLPESQISSQSCPLCFDFEVSNHPSNDAQGLELTDIHAQYQPSSKVLALLTNLSSEHHMVPAVKSIVFSSWTKMLNLVEVALTKNGFLFQRIDGKRTDEQRRLSLDTFRKNPRYSILLASIGSAGIGLDLTTASRVHLLEPQWSPMAEEQAIDRVHRMGQGREVVATRYIVKDSIEEHVVLVQRNKSELITQTLNSGESISAMSLKECLMNHLDGA